MSNRCRKPEELGSSSTSEGGSASTNLAVLLALVWIVLASAGAVASEVLAARVAILETSRSSMVLELEAPDISGEETVLDGTPCTLLNGPGLAYLARADRPLVPTTGILIAMPTLSGLRLDVLEAAGQALPSCALCETPDPAPPYNGSASSGQYPGLLAEIGSTAILRGQPVAQIQFYPLQVSFTGDRLKFYPRIRVRLSFDSDTHRLRPAGVAGGPFELLLKDVLVNFQARKTAPAGIPVSALARSKQERPALKIVVDHDGIVVVTPADLTAAGWDPSSHDPRTLQLTQGGAEVAILVLGQEDGSFDAGDYLSFLGQAAAGSFTCSNVYWLTSGAENGLRMAGRDASQAGGYEIARSYPATLHAEQDTPDGYWQNPPGLEAQDHWYWTGRLTAPTSAELSFQMPPFDPSAAAIIRVLLAGRTDDYDVNPDHHTRIALNGAPVDDQWWNGQTEFLHAVSLASGILAEGENTLTVETVGDTGATVDSLYVNWLEIGYQALYASQDDRLTFGAPAAGDHQFRLTGFTTDDVEVFDISDPSAPVQLVNVQTQSEGATYTAIFEDRATAGMRYLALTSAQYQSPASIAVDAPSDLRDPANGADEIIIAYDEFLADIEPLALHREAQGLRVKVVAVSDVYDEFSGGVLTPQAVREFLAYAYHHWAAPAPTYVLLVGDAHLDFLDRFGTGTPNYVPTHIFDSWSVGETGNDTWLACVDGEDPLPDLFIGRMCARGQRDVQAMVAKIIAYEGPPAPGDWLTRALSVADDDTSLFATVAEGWIDQLPPAYQPLRVYASDYPPGDPQADIVSAINDGVFMVTYIGHGNQDRWGTWSGGQLLQNNSVGQLTNSDHLPFVVTATCLNGFFVNPLLACCLAEELARKQDGGAIAVWSPTGLGSSFEHQILFARLFDKLFALRQTDAGSVTTRAKIAAFGGGVSQDLIETFTLFGDPATRFRVEPAANAPRRPTGRIGF